MDLSKRQQVARAAITEAGELLLKEFTSKQFSVIDNSSTHDIKIDTDKKSEELIINHLRKSFPEDNINSEESGVETKSNEYTWYIDPLDGTNNFAVGIPYFGACIALEFNGNIIMSLILNVVTNELFEAIKGKGAFLNQKKFKNTPRVKSIEMAVVSSIRGHQTFENKNLDEKAQKIEKSLFGKPKRVLNTWAPALDWTLLAKGDIDILISYHDELFEQFAGSLLAMEAGVSVVNFKKEPYSDEDQEVLACNPMLQDQILEIITKFDAY